MTTLTEIQSLLSYISVEAYLAGIGDGKPLKYTPGNKKENVYPQIAGPDGEKYDFVPYLDLGDTNITVLRKLEAATAVFYAFRKFKLRLHCQ